MDENLKDKIAIVIAELNQLAEVEKYKSIQSNIQQSVELLSSIVEYTPMEATIAETDCSLFEFDAVGQTWVIKKYIGFDDEHLIVPSTYEGKCITGISAGAFKNRKHLKSIQLNNCVQVIERNAFEGCTCLESITNTSKISYIGERAFYDCNSLETIGPLPCLERMGKEAFARTAINSFVIPPHVHYLSYKLFEHCHKLKSIKLHGAIQIIGKQCFEDCFALDSVEIPESVVRVCTEAFKNCVSIRDLPIYSFNTIWEEKVFVKTERWQPDLRYNPRYIYHPLQEMNALCLPGSTAQTYCNENNIRCSRISKRGKTITIREYPLDSIVGFELSKPTYKQAQQLLEVLTYCLSEYKTTTDVYTSNVTKSDYIRIQIIGEPITDVKSFRNKVVNRANCYQSLQYMSGDKIEYLFSRSRITLNQETSNTIW